MILLKKYFHKPFFSSSKAGKGVLNESRLMRYALISIALTLTVVLAHQTYNQKKWEQYRVAHGCEPTEFTEDLALGLITRAWTCDDGLVYYR